MLRIKFRQHFLCFSNEKPGIGKSIPLCIVLCIGNRLWYDLHSIHMPGFSGKE